MRHVTALVALALCVSIAFVSAQENQADHHNACPVENLRDMIVLALSNRDEFALFRRVVVASNINDLNIDPRRTKLTILAPTNAAFDRLADDLGFISAEDILNPGNAGLRNNVTFRGPVNNAVLTDTNNIKACKSYIHGIDNVLRPAN